MVSEKKQFETVRLRVPVKPEDLVGLKIGTVVYLDGVIYTAREGVYKRVIENGEPLPEGLTDLSNANFHCSPAASVEADGSYNVGGVTATASFRFSHWMAAWFKLTNAKLIWKKGNNNSHFCYCGCCFSYPLILYPGNRRKL
ncbi:MAG: fumarate hydratase C-terminal domain-containing protein [Proteobacteria bacterium]|nr:fumarate hydratase C-terminal domain-containing protein [Pseudomonadota bacterium]